MMEEPLSPQERVEDKSSSHIVHALLQFAVAVKHRKNVVLLCVFVTLALGALYYSTATRLYSAKAELFIIASGDDARSTGLSGQGRDGNNLMPTFERVITSARVVEQAIEKLRPEDQRVDLAEVPRSRWVAAVQRNLSAKSIYGTNNIEIEYLSRDPAVAVAMVNQVVDCYLEELDAIHKQTADDLISHLEQQQREISEKLQQWQILLSQQKNACGDMLNTDPDSKSQHPLFDLISNTNKMMLDRKNERMEVEAKLASLQEAVARGEDLEPHIMAVEETVGRELLMSHMGLNAQTMANLATVRQQKMEDTAKLQAMLVHYGEQHPEIQNLRAKILAADQLLAGSTGARQQPMNAAERARLARSLEGLLKQRVDALVRHEQKLAIEQQNLQRQADGINDQLIAIQATERQIDWGNELRDRLLNQLATLTGAEEGPIIRSQTISNPVQATAPTSPNLRRVAMLSLLAGLAMGLAIVYVLDILDDRFRSVEELQSQLGVPVLAIVQDLPRQDVCGVETLQLVAEPDAPESEAFRTLRTSLGLNHDRARRIVVSSAEPGDGKSTVLANAAVAYAHGGKRTLLIDADLRRPGLSTLLNLRGMEGLSTVLRGQGPVTETVEGHIQQTAVAGFDVLPSGPRPMNPAELLGGQNFADLLAWAESRYDRILIDSPPVLAASDTAVIGQLVDGVLMVVQPLRNQRRLVLRAVESFAMLKIPVIGIVANRVGEQGGSNYYGYAVDYSARHAEQCSDDYEYNYRDEIDCPPEPTRQTNTRRRDRDGGIDLSQLGDSRRRDAA